MSYSDLFILNAFENFIKIGNAYKGKSQSLVSNIGEHSAPGSRDSRHRNTDPPSTVLADRTDRVVMVNASSLPPNRPLDLVLPTTFEGEVR